MCKWDLKWTVDISLTELFTGPVYDFNISSIRSLKQKAQDVMLLSTLIIALVSPAWAAPTPSRERNDIARLARIAK